jgi:hypothetical protein
VTISYVSRRYSLDIRVGENETRILSPRRIDTDSQHTRTAKSKNLWTLGTAPPHPRRLRWSGVRARSNTRATHVRHWNWAIA